MSDLKLNDVEEKRVNNFKIWHKRCQPKNTFKEYKPFKYEFAPNGIGVAVKIMCPYCNKVKDISDIDSW